MALVKSMWWIHFNLIECLDTQNFSDMFSGKKDEWI